MIQNMFSAYHQEQRKLSTLLTKNATVSGGKWPNTTSPIIIVLVVHYKVLHVNTFYDLYLYWLESLKRIKSPSCFNFTDLSSLIGNFDWGYSTVWKFSHFPATLILREIYFGWFQRVKNCHFNTFGGFEFGLLEI